MSLQNTFSLSLLIKKSFLKTCYCFTSYGHYCSCLAAEMFKHRTKRVAHDSHFMHIIIFKAWTSSKLYCGSATRYRYFNFMRLHENLMQHQ